MAILKQAKKAIKRDVNRTVFNLRRGRAMKTQVKEVRELAADGKVKEAMEKMPAAHQAIDKAAKRGVVHNNTAARMKSRLSAFVKSAGK